MMVTRFAIPSGACFLMLTNLLSLKAIDPEVRSKFIEVAEQCKA